MGYIWTITYAVSAGNAPELNVDGVALEGVGAAGNLLQIQSSRAPEIQRISTSATSPIAGGFTIEFGAEETMQIAHNASAAQVE